MNSSEQRCLFLLSKCRSLKLAKQIHAHVYKNGLDIDPLVAGKLLLLCAISISDALHYARCLLQQFPNPNVFMYNTLIRGLAESETPHNSLHTFIKMRRESNVLPDSFSFAFILKVVANCRSSRTGLQLHGQALCHGLDNHLFVGTTLISMYAECGNVHSARQVFEEMSDPNVFTRNVVVTASFRCGDVEGAEDMFKRMPIRNLTSWNVILAGYTKAGKLELARQAFSEMPLKDDVSWSTMIVGFAHNGFFDEAFGFFFYKTMVDGLKEQVLELVDARERVQVLVEEGKQNGEETLFISQRNSVKERWQRERDEREREMAGRERDWRRER